MDGAEEAEKKRRPFSSLRNDPLKMRFGKYLPSFCDKSLLFTKHSVTLVVVLVNWLHVVPGPGQEGGCNYRVIRLTSDSPWRLGNTF